MRRTTLAATTGALLVPLLSAAPALAAPGAATPPPPQRIDAFCTDQFGGALFTDTESTVHQRAIHCAAVAAVAEGGPGTLGERSYGPNLLVRRDQMASFIARMMDAAASIDTDDHIQALPDYDGTSHFTDVDGSNVHAHAINRLAQAGIVQGGPDGLPPEQYGPSLDTDRAQMASFVNRAVEYMTGSGFTSTSDYFTDDESSVHQDDINAVASVGVAVGNGADSYRPRQDVPRDQMASFLVRTLAVLQERGLVGDISGAATGPRAGNGAATPMSPASLQGVDIARHDTYDRITFTFAAALPDWRVRYIDQLRGPGSGEVVPLEGDQRLAVTFNPIGNTPAQSYSPHLPAIYDVEQLGSFEGQETVGIGVRTATGTAPRVPFHVGTVGSRLYIDVEHYTG